MQYEEPTEEQSECADLVATHANNIRRAIDAVEGSPLVNQTMLADARAELRKAELYVIYAIMGGPA